MICVGYSKRASCIDDVTKVGLKEQSDRIRKFASENKLKLSRFYEERSDDPNSDTGFNELRKDGLNRKFDLVIFESMLRFGAGILIAKNLLLNTFFLMGIHFIVIEDDLDSRNETYESLDKYFIDKYRSAKGQQLYLKMDKTTRNFFMKERFGYSFDPNGMGMIVDDEAADVIRMIYSMALNGMTKKKIADYLTENNYETPQTHLHNVSASMRKQGQGIWRTSTVCRILSDERYIGHTDKNGIEYPTIITEEEFQNGYIRNSRKTRYLVRRDCGDYVKLIFLWTVIGVDGGEIARRLALLGAPVPSEETPSKGGGKWTSGCVRRILNNPAYQGDVCMGKSSQRFGGSGYVYQKNHKADWTIHERRHEPLVTRIDQEMVFEMIRVNARRNRVDQHKDVAGCFKGILYCKECDRPLITITDRSNEPRFTNSAFVKHCCNPVPYYSKHCNNFVSDDFLKYVVMESIKHHIKLVTDKKDIIQMAKESGNGKDLALSIDKKITSASSFLADEREKQLKLYEDYQTGVVDKDDFNILNRKCSERISLLQDKLKELQIKKNEYMRAINSYLTMIGDLKIEGDEYGFDPKLVKKLVARIDITRDKRIEITYKDTDIDQMINKALEGLI